MIWSVQPTSKSAMFIEVASNTPCDGNATGEHRLNIISNSMAGFSHPPAFKSVPSDQTNHSHSVSNPEPAAFTKGETQEEICHEGIHHNIRRTYPELCFCIRFAAAAIWKQFWK